LENRKIDHALYEPLRREHAELRELLAGVHRTLAERREAAASVSRMLSSMCDHLETHFREEEVTGFFDSLDAKAPRLVDQTDDLRGQHTQMTAQFRALITLATRGDGSAAWWQELEDEFHKFSKELMHHESKEVELLQVAYDVDIGSQD
jgi:iron-sulfur cluster repair protein YtfE (RIC family)